MVQFVFVVNVVKTGGCRNLAIFEILVVVPVASGASGASNAVRGVMMQGYTFPSPATVYYNAIQYITMATLGNSVDFGDMSDAVSQSSGASSPTRVVSMGGTKAPGDVDVIEYVQIMTTGNAVDFGNLLAARRGGSASSNGNGGLG